MERLLLFYFMHLPYPAWTDPGAESAAYATFFIHHVFKGPRLSFMPVDGLLRATGLAYPAVPAQAA